MRYKLFKKTEIDKYLSSNCLFNKDQLEIINSVTPKDQIEIVDDGYGKYKSVKPEYARYILNLVTGFNYDFDILSETETNGEITTLARLTIRSNSITAFRTQRGKYKLKKSSQDINGKTYTRYSNIGDGYKAAATNALKKCMSEFMFFWDIYSSENQEVIIDEEEKKLSYADQNIVDKFKKAIERCKSNEDIDFELEKLQDNVSNKEILEICQKIVDDFHHNDKLFV